MKEKRFLQTSTFKIILFTVIYLYLTYILAPLSIQICKQIFHCSMTTSQTLCQYGYLGSYFLCMILGIIIFRKKLKLDIIKFKETFWTNIGKIILTCILMVIGSIIFSVTQIDNQIIIDPVLNTKIIFSNFYLMFIFLIVGSFNEKLLFHEVIIGQIGKEVPKWILIITSSIVFGLIRIVSFDQLPQSLPFIWNGFILSMLYASNKNNVILSSCAYTLNNLINIFL